MATPTPEQEVGQSMMGRIIGGARNMGTVFTGARVGLRADSQAFSTIKRGVTEIEQITKRIAVNMDNAARSMKSFGGRGGGGGGGTAQNGMPMFNNSSQHNTAETSGGTPNYAKSLVRQSAPFFLANSAAASLQGLSTRIERGREYALSADRLNSAFQQRTGMSQSGLMNLRSTLDGARLGIMGRNDLMAFQYQNGQISNLAQYGNSIAGIRALNGYASSTGDVLQTQQSYMGAATANRMLWTLGVNAYKMGGGMNDPLKMRQQIIQSMGLTSASAMKGAFTQGSVTRARMADAGITDESAQNELLQYAQSNLTFRQKGGKGFYDPSKAADRKLLGVEGNLSTQAEETDRLRGNREERFARDQLKSMATQEKQNQWMIKELSSIEHYMKTLVSIYQRSSNVRSIGGKVLQAGLMMGAAFLAPETGGGSMALLGLAAGAGALSGDPPASGSGGSPSSSGGSTNTGNDAGIMVPVGYKGQRQSLAQLKERPDFKGLKPQMQDRLLNMMRANPNVGFGGGSRSSSQQEALFRSRYTPTNEKTDTFWNGQYWKHTSGANAAPPGFSMHEIGLAADLVGDMDWLVKNSARFGLRNFANYGGEKWHVQPSELPGDRATYEKQGASWGTDSYGKKTAGSKIPAALLSGSEDGSGSVLAAMAQYSGMSMSEIVAAMGANLHVGGAGAGQGMPSSGKLAGTTKVPNTGGPLTATDVARLAYNAGFRGEDLVKAVAIANRESHFRPNAFNGNSATGDLSFGLWQINMKGGLGPARLKQFGISSNEALLDPATNAHAAYVLYQRNGNTLNAWGAYKGQSNTHNADQYMTMASQAVHDAHLGDPSARTPMAAPQIGSGGNVSAPTYHIAPVITFQGTPGTSDLRKIAKAVTDMIEQNVRTMEMRSA